MSEETLDPELLHNSADIGEIATEVCSEANLPQAGALQSAIFNSANFSYIATDAKGVIQIFNVGAERMLGYSAAEVMNKITPADISDPQEVIARAEALSIELGTPIAPGFEALVFKASRGIEDIYELTYFRKDGSRFPAIVSVTALRDAQDGIIGYLLIGTDNTARKQAEGTLRKSTDLLKCVLDNVPARIFWKDLDLRYLGCNSRFAADAGYSSPHELTGKTDFDMVWHDQAKQYQADDMEVIEYGLSKLNFEEGQTTPQGKSIWLRTSKVPMRDENDQIFGVLGIYEEITGLKIAEEALLKAGALQSAIFNSANFSSIATDAKGVIQIFNVGAERMLGYTAAEVMNKITPADISDHHEVIARAEDLSLELGTPISPGFEALAFKASRGIEDIYELTYIRKDGSRFPAVVSVTALRDEQNAIIGYLLIGTDNTARKEAEEQKKKFREELEIIIDNIPGPVFYKDTENRFIRVNKYLAEAMGLGKFEMEGKDCFELYPREDANSYWKDDLEVINSGVSKLGIDEPYETASGPGWLITSKVPFIDGSGKCVGIIGVSVDNTARKHAEEALFKAGELQRAIFNSENFSSIATDAKGVIQIFNVGAERMLGYSAIDVMNKITPADISDPQEVIARAEALSIELGTPIAPGFEALVFKASRGIEDIYELTYFRKDGSRFPAIVSVTALRDAQDAIIGYLLIGTDNTARKLIEAEQVQLSQRLRDHQFYTRSLFECNIDAIMTTDPSGIITDVNKQMEVLSSCTRDELIGAPFKNYFTDPVRAETSIKKVLREKKVTNFELTACSRDGVETVVSINATTFYDRDRRLQGVFAAARDVTERKRLDEVLQEKNLELENARSVAEKTNLAKSDFLANMSHELRTPLNSVIGFSEVLQDRLFGTVNEKQYEYITNILTSGRHLLSLINDILDLSKVESGKMELELSNFSLRETVEASLMMLMEKALKGGIKLHLDIDAEADVRIVADQRKLKQVLFNLLSNAVKFTPNEGLIDVSILKKGDFIEITVADSGIGIKEDDIPKLFHPFTQLESVYTKEYEGTGLGLALNRHLVELHGGRVWVDSTFGAGSRFSFTIPLNQETTKGQLLANQQ